MAGLKPQLLGFSVTIVPIMSLTSTGFQIYHIIATQGPWRSLKKTSVTGAQDLDTNLIEECFFVTNSTTCFQNSTQSLSLVKIKCIVMYPRDNPWIQQ